MSQKKYKILCFTDNEIGRDVEIILPVRYFAENFLDCTFIHAFVYDIHAIYREKPDVVFLANTVGSNFYFYVSKYAYDQGIPVFALTSEGNFRTDGSFPYWGYNFDKNFHQDYVCLWSQRTVDFLQKELPEIKDKIVLTGGTGFDRYKIYNFAERQKYLRDHGVTKTYNKVIGYAGWAFGKLSNKQGLEEMLFWLKNDQSKLKWLEDQRDLVEGMLKYAIENNPDTLFILKKHPNEHNPSIVAEGRNEMNRLTHFENVLYITSEESVYESLSISDLWLAFESTTALEGWLMGKQSIFLNPDPDFARDPNYKGSVIVKNGKELQNVIDEYYSSGRVEEFFKPEKESERQKIIKDTIGFADGLNHIRAGFYLQKTLKTVEERRKNFKFHLNYKYLLMYGLLHSGKYFFNRKLFSKLPKFKKTIWVFERFRLLEIEKGYQKNSKSFDQFYQKLEIKTKFENGSLYKELFNNN